MSLICDMEILKSQYRGRILVFFFFNCTNVVTNCTKSINAESKELLVPFIIFLFNLKLKIKHVLIVLQRVCLVMESYQ